MNLSTSFCVHKSLIDDQGFVVECRLPLQSIRFPDKKSVVMGLVVFRREADHSHSDFAILRFKHSLADDAYIGGFYRQGERSSMTPMRPTRDTETEAAWRW